MCQPKLRSDFFKLSQKIFAKNDFFEPKTRFMRPNLLLLDFFLLALHTRNVGILITPLNKVDLTV